MSNNQRGSNFLRRMQHFASAIDSLQEEFIWGVASELQRKDTEALRRRMRHAGKAALNTSEAAAWKLCNDIFMFVERRI